MPSFDIRCVQKDVLLIPFRLTVTAGVPALSEGGSYLTVVDGGVGIYQFAFGGAYGTPSARIPIVTVNAMATTTNEIIANVIEATLLTTGFTVEVNDDAGTAADFSIMGTIIWFGTADKQ